VVVAVDSEVAVLAEEDLEAVDPVVEEVLSDLEECDLLVDHSDEQDLEGLFHELHVLHLTEEVITGGEDIGGAIIGHGIDDGGIGIGGGVTHTALGIVLLFIGVADLPSV
jgi:hypothetical protein